MSSPPPDAPDTTPSPSPRPSPSRHTKSPRGKGGGRRDAPRPGGGGPGSHKTQFHRVDDSLLSFRAPPRPHNPSSGGRGGSNRGRPPSAQQRAASARERRHRVALADRYFVHASAAHRTVTVPFHDPAEARRRLRVRCPGLELGASDVPVPWEDIRAVKTYVRTPDGGDGDDGRTCPICLEAPECPRCGPCGHAFCLACLLRHLCPPDGRDRGPYGTCPCCHASLSVRDLRTVQFVSAPGIAEGKGGALALLERTTWYEDGAEVAHRVRTAYGAGTTSGGDDAGTDAVPDCAEARARYGRVTSMGDGPYLALLGREAEVLLGHVGEDPAEGAYTEMAAQAVFDEMERVRAGPVPTEALARQTGPPAAPVREKKVRECHFYQWEDGQAAFLCGFNMRCLEHEAQTGGRTSDTGTGNGDETAGALGEENPTLEGCVADGDGRKGGATDEESGGDRGGRHDGPCPLPRRISANVLSATPLRLTPDARRRHPFLSHMPLYTDVTILELDLHRYLGPKTRTAFAAEKKARAEARRKVREAEKRKKRAVKGAERKQLAEEKTRKEMRERAASVGSTGEDHPPLPPLNGAPNTHVSSGDGDSAEEAAPPASPAPAPAPAPAVASYTAVVATRGLWPGLDAGGGGRGAAAAPTPAAPPVWARAVAVPTTTSPAPAPRRKSGSRGKSGKKVLLFATGGGRRA